MPIFWHKYGRLDANKLYFRFSKNTFSKRFHLNSNTMCAFQEYAKIAERSGRNIIETFSVLQPGWKFSGKSGPSTEVVLFDVQFRFSKNNCTIVNRISFNPTTFHKSLLVWPNESNPLNFAKEFRVRVANQIINKLAKTWFRKESFLGLSLSTWTFSAYPFATF